MLTVTNVMCHVTDMKASIQFYKDVCGFKLKAANDFLTQFDLGNGINLSLHPSRGVLKKTDSQSAGWTLTAQVNDIVDARKRLEQAGAKVTREFHDVPGFVLLDIEDPDGNPITLSQAGITMKDLASIQSN